MSITLRIPVPNIGSLIPTYDAIRIYRSVSTRDGPFSEVTASASAVATLLGSVVGPFPSLNGKTLILRLTTSTGTAPDIAVSFLDPNPITALQASVAIAAVAPTLIGSSVDGGAVRISTVETGTAVRLQIVGGDGLASLGMGLYAQDTGEAPYVPLLTGDTDYSFIDPTGLDTYWYRWQFFHTISLASSALKEPIQASTPRIDPVRKLDDARASRGLTLLRGREHTFRMSFWEDQAANLPLTPMDANRYPSYVVVDPTGTVLQTGRAETDAVVPNYKVMFVPAADAILSNDDRRWRIDWYMLTTVGRFVQASELFDVRDVDVTETETKDQKHMALEGAPKRIRIALPKRPVSVMVQLENANDPTQTILPLPAVYPPSGPNPSLTEIPDGDRYVYHYDVPTGLLLGGSDGMTYQAVWSILPTPLSEEDNVFQIIDVPPRQTFQYMQSLRQAIDKFQKKQNMIQAYQDSDIYEYLRRGLQLINGMDPIHISWQLTSVPSVVQPYWLLGAMWWGLNAQQGSEIDLSFGFSGQSVTLDYDHAAAIDGYANKMMEAIKTSFGPLKKQLYRRQASVGTYSGRALRRTGVNNHVFQIGHDRSGSGVNLLSILTNIGLI